MQFRFGRWFNLCVMLFLALMPLAAQEAGSGFDLRATISGEAIYSNQLTQAPRDGSAEDAAFRAVFYPYWKLNGNWSVQGAVQVSSNPYFTENFDDPGHAVTTRILRANIGYTRSWKSGSIAVHAGQLGSAVGSFNLRYDDAANPLVDVPVIYGYYAKITTASVAGVQVDLTQGKWDARVQLVNSSLANPRNILEKDQYGNWAAGAGYTILPGLRVGVSGARGPYLDRKWEYFFPGESNPNTLPASSVGGEIQLARGHWNVEGEWDWLMLPYRAIPFVRRNGGYAEAKRVLSARWYAAARVGYLSTNGSIEQVFEAAAGFHAAPWELIKFECEIQRDSQTGQLSPIAMMQFVTTIHPLSFAWR